MGVMVEKKQEEGGVGNEQEEANEVVVRRGEYVDDSWYPALVAE